MVVVTTRARAVAGGSVLLVLLLAVILVPFLLWEGPLDQATARLLREPRGQLALALVLGGLLAADIALPVPSSVVNTAAGGLLGFWGGTAAAWAGMTAGCVAGYLVGRGASGTSLRRLAGDVAVERISRAAERHGAWILVVFRAVPVLAEGSMLFAGFSRMPLRRVLALSALANLGVAATYAAIGAYAMEVDSFLLAFAGAICVPALVLLATRRLQR